MKTYSISNSTITASVKSYGAELASLRTADGHEYLWQGSPEYWTGQSPLLFPIVGGLADNRYTHDGREYSMKSHGFARKSEWELKAQREDSLEFSLESSPEILESFPFRFRLSVIYSVSGPELRVEYLVENLDASVMPFQIGAHPGFNCPIESFDEDGSRLQLTDYEIVFEKSETAERLMKDTILTGETLPCLESDTAMKLSHSLFDDDALIFRDIASERVWLKRKDGAGRRIELDFPGFTHFGIWKKPKTDAPYICLEPWFGVDSTEGGPTELAEKEGMLQLSPGKSFHAQYSILLS